MRAFLIIIGNLLNYGNPSFLYKYKNLLYRIAGIKIGKKTLISSGFKCLYPQNISIENNVAIGHDISIWAFHRVIIKQYSTLAKDMLIISGSHDVNSFEPLKNQEVTIGEGCWVGARTTILGGTSIGKGCVVGAGSLVNRDIPDCSIAAGVPAKVIRKREVANVNFHISGKFITKDILKTNDDHYK